MNQDDFVREKYQRDMAKLQPAGGKYVGPLYSVSTGEYMGALVATVEATTKAASGAGSSKTVGEPVLQAEFEFMGNDKVSIKALEAYFDSETGIYKANIPVKRGGTASGQQGSGASGSDSYVYINGVIARDGSFVGTIEATEGASGHQEYGGRFRLLKDGQMPSEKPSREILVDLENFVGDVTFALQDPVFPEKDPKRKALLVLVEQSSSAAEDFLSIFLPTKHLEATLSFSDDVRIVFANGLFDRVTGRLEADASISQPINSPAGNYTVAGNLRLECKKGVVNGRYGYRCEVWNNTAPHSVAKGEFAILDPDVPLPRLKAAGQRSRIQVYKGEGNFPTGPELKQRHWRNVSMSVTCLSRSTVEEILDFLLPRKEKFVSVSIAFPDVVGVSAPFTSIRYDLDRETLVGMQDIMVGGIPARMTLSCDGFNFGSATRHSNFCCSFMNSSNNIEIPLGFSKRCQ